MNKPLDFQSIMIALQRYWGEQGCLIWQPYYTQVGAGTMNPATILRVLGPEPWNVAYVEPSIRPDDGRYGENPNRMQQHYQYQVILKPDPGNPQELYLRSLEAIGIDVNQHDIRFVEDNWESPALGAWGLGWEVWLDGMEITQFTYFQQAGGMNLDPVAVEITYGLERISMALQRVRNFRDIRWNEFYTYGDVNLQGEQEHSKYYFEIADVEGLRQMYDLFEKEAETSLKNDLILPAHDYVLKCSHTFNILDTRGAIGVTERQALFSRMRDLSRRVSEAYYAKREELGFPWLEKSAKAGAKEVASIADTGSNEAENGSAHSFLFEIGTEELPAADLQSALAQLNESIPALIDNQYLDHGDIKIMGTPRRLVVYIENLSDQQSDRTTVVKGPPADRAFDAQGNPTKAGEGFARSKGLDIKDLEIREMDGGRYAVALVHEKGRKASEVLAELLPGVIAGIRFEKSMRWNESNVAFSRPIRWLLALYGKQVVSFEYAGIPSGRKTRLLRFSDTAEMELASPNEYFSALLKEGILLDVKERSEVIFNQVTALTESVKGVSGIEQGLLEEVTNLVEAPTALLGKFEEEYLKLPPEVLISVMKKHQRYFPVKSPEGGLMPYFIAVRNGGKEHLDIVADGNEQVIRARFADAAFFIREDRKTKLEDLLSKLSTLTFQVKLGSMLDKSKRIEKLVESLFAFLDLNDAEKKTAKRAAYLCKADLVSHMVVEMTSLQGIMGKFYGLHSGETQETADAIFEHYLPRFAGDMTPEKKPGLVIGIADRLDTLMGLFAADLAPSGTKDPFAQRRAALGLVQNLIAWDVDFDLHQGLSLAAENLPLTASEQSQTDCFNFIVGRLRNLLLEQGNRYDVVDAVLAAQQSNPAGASRAVAELSKWVARDDWNAILPAFSRCVRITRDLDEKFEVNSALIDDTSEKDLYEALVKAEQIDRAEGSVKDFFDVFTPMIPVINAFFDNVLVMAEDENVRKNRLGLLQRIAQLSRGVSDLSFLEGF